MTRQNQLSRLVKNVRTETTIRTLSGHKPKMMEGVLAAETEEGAREETAEKHNHQLGQAERPGHETAVPDIGWRGIESFGDDVERTNQKSERGGKTFAVMWKRQT